jgi:hypothetical protein
MKIKESRAPIAKMERALLFTFFELESHAAYYSKMISEHINAPRFISGVDTRANPEYNLKLRDLMNEQYQRVVVMQAIYERIEDAAMRRHKHYKEKYREGNRQKKQTTNSPWEN